jgi:drug/metabolite transporter (DMT)-like permease
MPQIVILYALFASIFIFGKNLLMYCTPLFAVGFRMTLAGAIFLIYLLIFKKEKLKFTKSQWYDLICLSIFNIFLTNVLEFWGLQHLDAAKTCFLYSLSPFFSMMLSYFFFKERTTLKKWMGVIIGIAGFVPLLIHQSPQEEKLTHLFSILSLAELAVIGATIASVLGWIFLRKLVKSDISPFAANGISMFIGGILSLISSFIVDSWDPFPVTQWKPVLMYSLIIGIISNGICYNLYGKLLKTYTASFLAFCGIMTPFFAAILGYLFLNEVLTWHFLTSGIIVFIGLLIFYSEDLKQGYICKENKKKKKSE